MAQVVSIEDVRPAPRYDGDPWTHARFEEATLAAGPWNTLETIALSPVDSDPQNPAYRNFTTDLASDTVGLWYRIVFTDAGGDIGLPTFPIQNVEDDRPVYASVAELALLLKVNATARHNSLMRVLKAAADEIDAEVGETDIASNTTPYSNPPPIVREVNIERAVEHWQQEQAPFGLVGLGTEFGPTFTARNSWERHAQKLAVLKGEWGLA